jgi:hypothetical protein
MAKMTPIFRGAFGLNNTVESTRLAFDEKTSMGELATAYNVDVDSRGRVSRRPGWNKVASFYGSDMFCEGGDCLFVGGTSLYQLLPDYTRKGLRSGLTPNARLSCAQAPDRIFYTNGFENGYVRQGASWVWQVGEYVGPDTSRTFSNPPIGQLVEFYAGRTFVAKGRHLLWSEGFNWGAFDLARNFLSYGTDITMVKAVNDGLFLSDQTTTYFIGGRNPKEFEQIVVAPYSAIPYTVARVQQAYVTDKKRGKVIIWATNMGLCAGSDGGQFENATLGKLTYPTCSEGTAAALADKYIVLLSR